MVVGLVEDRLCPGLEGELAEVLDLLEVDAVHLAQVLAHAVDRDAQQRVVVRVDLGGFGCCACCRPELFELLLELGGHSEARVEELLPGLVVRWVVDIPEEPFQLASPAGG